MTSRVRLPSVDNISINGIKQSFYRIIQLRGSIIFCFDIKYSTPFSNENSPVECDILTGVKESTTDFT